MQTTQEILRSRAASNPDHPLVRVRGEQGWTTVTVAEGLAASAHLAAGLAGRGVVPGDRVAILSENRWEWLLVDLALRHLGAVTVALYPTDHPASWTEILRDCKSQVLFVSGSLALPGRKIAADAGVPTVVGFDGAGAGITPLADLLAAEPIAPVHLRGGDLATLVYTSGTTGRPKGAMLTHDNLSSNAAGAIEYFAIGTTDHYLSFLPLSHAFERTAVAAMLRAGACVWFGRGLSEVVADLREVSPTIVCTVPRVLEKVVAKVQEKLAAAGVAKRQAFAVLSAITGALGDGEGTWRSRLRHRLGAAFFRDIHAIFGPRLRYVVSGGARLAPEVSTFFTRVGVTIYEGYGITECSPIVAACHGARTRVGTVGEPLPGIEVRIAGDGEILVRGPCVMRGYWGDDAATRSAIDNEGWFHTGDLGELGLDGLLAIGRRKKELFVTSGGKNIAPVHVEGALTRSPLLAQACAVGDGKNYVAALIVPEMGELTRRLAARGVAAPPADELPRFAPALELVQREIDAANEQLAQYERVKRFALVSEEMSVANGLLTPTLKMKRGRIEERYAAVIADLYANPHDAAREGPRGAAA